MFSGIVEEKGIIEKIAKQKNFWTLVVKAEKIIKGVKKGDSIAVGNGSLTLNKKGLLDGQLRLTVVGLEAFLNSIGAQQMVQSSSSMDKVAGALDRLAPGLGNVARQQAGANIAAGINLLGEQTTLEGKRAVALPLRFSDGAIFLGPVPIGNAPALF